MDFADTAAANEVATLATRSPKQDHPIDISDAGLAGTRRRGWRDTRVGGSGAGSQP